MHDNTTNYSSFDAEIGVHLPYLRNQAYRLTRDHDEAKDLVQDSLMKAYKNYHKYTEGTNGKAWMSRIMKNTFINSKRKMSAIKEINSDTTSEYHNSASMSYKEKFGSGMDDNLQKAMERISKRQRQLIYLRYYMSLKYEEIAKLLGMPEGTVKTGLFKAKRKMKLSLQAAM